MTKKYAATLCAITVMAALLGGCKPKPEVTHEELVEVLEYRALVLEVPLAAQGKPLYFKKERSDGYVDYWSAFTLPAEAAYVKLIINPSERTLHYVQGFNPEAGNVTYYRDPAIKSQFDYPDYPMFSCPGGTMNLSDFYFVYSDDSYGREIAVGGAVFPEDDERSKARWMRITLIPESELPKGWLGHNLD
ncbi:MAG: hypothetical protein Q7Q73_10470 [Verrucomicrobiota bacterium JB024]|jgi:hypothetical protein|nr:hypothetical protein [Verrucomicrobiota bacterium JB024]